jgi:hypothetical protein
MQQPTNQQNQGFSPPARQTAAAPNRRSKNARDGAANPRSPKQGPKSPEFDKKTPKGHDGEAVRERFEGQFFKTKLCVFWEKGRCVRGTMCKYAHGNDELQAMPDLTNTAMCRTMAETGRCDRPGCLYAHSHENLRATDNFYKTTMCSFFRCGRCRLGALCRHAHSESELRKALQAKASMAREQQGPGYEDVSSTSASGGEGDKNLELLGPARQNSQQSVDSDDLELSPSTWDRTSTMPASLEQPGKFTNKKKASDDFLLRDRNIGRRFQPARSKLLWADLQEEDDEECVQNMNTQISELSQAPTSATTIGQAMSYDSLPDMPDDMWARMQTTPARMQRGNNQMMMPGQQQVVMMLVPVTQAQGMMQTQPAMMQNQAQGMIATAPGTPQCQPMMQPSYSGNFVPIDNNDNCMAWDVSKLNQGGIMMQAPMMGDGMSPMNGMNGMCVPAAMCMPMPEQVYHPGNQVIGS